MSTTTHGGREGRCRLLQTRDQARRVSKNDFAVHGAGSHRRPAPAQAHRQKLVGARPMVPDGDRLHYAESGDVIDEAQAAGVVDHDIVTELILGDHVRNSERRIMALKPVHGALDGMVLQK